MISCRSGCVNISISVFFTSPTICTWSATICRRSVIFCSTLAKSWTESGWLTLSWSSRECSTVSCSSSIGLTLSRPGRSGPQREKRWKGHLQASQHGNFSLSRQSEKMWLAVLSTVYNRLTWRLLAYLPPTDRSHTKEGPLYCLYFLSSIFVLES